ncbi:uncharacterized protein SPPG_08409 [Spizellomyces punctatus DAOM BR117]|uniref:Response regulatory domain-containing protein n=1 Tax=Spizellomyces punctatus (strain DAOM BR117) TaxID=645134 RepID=A0A0L0H4X3_SPIPD|nr:uncharacterized protein SPPG_08409 [Spizellomyces punctatus DAOM BR117]KNC96257.1 hypothetical protein SPPG_08409 [Spizellomyces punctatus DAOM BR117]|eukprot:XP_016604297.1 hypothetical protein SPPG_08409 [Spizellomyces punctatus DAOM BR117]
MISPQRPTYRYFPFPVRRTKLSFMQTDVSRDIDWKQFRIAVVDDNDINQKIICKLLKKFLDVDIKAADIFENGQLCLNAMAQHRYDLVLLDIEMPVLDGCETALRIRSGLPSPPLSTLSSAPENPSPTSPSSPTSPFNTDSDTESPAVLKDNRDIPIVVVTCNAMDHQRRHYLSLGVNAVVAKPLHPELFITTVKAHLAAFAARAPKEAVEMCQSDAQLSRLPDPQNRSQEGARDSNTPGDGGLSTKTKSRMLRILESVLQADGLERAGSASRPKANQGNHEGVKG